MSATLTRREAVTTEHLQELLNHSDENRARVILAAARTGELQAQVMLGQTLLQGLGIQRDPQLALTWFELAAQRGSAMAFNMLGRCHEHGWGCAVDLPAAADYYHQAAERSLDWGMYNLANLMATGRGVERDLAAAFSLYLQAAELGHAKSMDLVGRCYEDGLGVASDPAAAHTWYRRSAQAGDFRGQFSLAGVLIAQGLFEEAEDWLRQALANGNLKFLRSARQALLQVPLARLRAIARDYHKRAAELGDAGDQQALEALAP